MSRMERNKELHKKLAEEKQTSKESIFARRTIAQEAQDPEDDAAYDQSLEDHTNTHRRSSSMSIDPRVPHTQIRQGHTQHNRESNTKQSTARGADSANRGQSTNQETKKQAKKQKNKQKQAQKKRKKRPFLRIVIRILLFLLIYSVGAFFIGQQVARSDASIPKDDAETFNGVTSADGSNNILLIGSDSREGETGRADTIMVLQLDGGGQPKLVSFMRDTLVTIPGYGENKINAAYAFGGAELVQQTLAQNFGVETKYYTKVDFQSFEKVIDTLFPSGVSINAEKDMSKNLEVAIKKGQQQMNGLELLQYARFRMDEEGDFGRVRRQQQVIDAIFSEMKNPLSIAKLPYAAGKVLGYASTNLPVTFLLKNTFSIARGAAGIERLTVPVDDSWQYGNSDTAGSVLVVDLQTNQQAISDFFNQ